MNYFRAVVKANELSERALRLTDEVIRLNAANYTAWYRPPSPLAGVSRAHDVLLRPFVARYYRRKVLAALKTDFKEELQWVERIAAENPKNYQIWFVLVASLSPRISPAVLMAV